MLGFDSLSLNWFSNFHIVIHGHLQVSSYPWNPGRQWNNNKSDTEPPTDESWIEKPYCSKWIDHYFIIMLVESAWDVRTGTNLSSIWISLIPPRLDIVDHVCYHNEVGKKTIKSKANVKKKQLTARLSSQNNDATRTNQRSSSTYNNRKNELRSLTRSHSINIVDFHALSKFAFRSPFTANNWQFEKQNWWENAVKENET